MLQCIVTCIACFIQFHFLQNHEEKKHFRKNNSFGSHKLMEYVHVVYHMQN